MGPEKYDETTAAMIALLKYGSGMPFYRLEKLERLLGIPLPASTQWATHRGWRWCFSGSHS
jgi:transposase